MTTWDQVQVAAAAIRSAIAPRKPCLGIVLGSGLGDFAERLQGAVAVPYAALPGFVPSTVSGHAGRLIAGNCAGVPLLVMQGRIHRYEGHSLAQVVLPVRALVAAGCTTLVLTNAAGGIRADLGPGSLVLITDHLNLLGDNPLCGANDERLGPRFPDLSEAYDPALRAAAQRAARTAGVALAEGVYAALSGPSYETPAEIRMLRTLGADLVGMSTVPEVIAARHMGARVLGLSCVANAAAGLGGALSHAEVTATVGRMQQAVTALLEQLIPLLVAATTPPLITGRLGPA
ncbi:MAG: purine-nucleoside phosphorylase [Proteobacteria bacterium]|nr:purine-nucleoside phosphorylase [Pseudomonadota bacterium]